MTPAWGFEEVHGSAWYGDGRWMGKESIQRDRDIATMQSMGIRWLKLLTGGLSQLDAAEAFVKAGFEVIVRWYMPPVNDASVPYSELKPFADVGINYTEGFSNEPEAEWGRPPIADVIDKLAAQHIRFADTCAHAGLIPCTPAIQGDRLNTWFLPMCQRIIDKGRQDVLEGSVVAGHWRPGTYYGSVRFSGGLDTQLYPPDIEPRQPDGQPGFAFRSYEMWDDAITALLGHPLPLLGTEAGYEPSESRSKVEQWNDDSCLARHAVLNVKLAQIEWRPSLFCQCFWILTPGGMGNDPAWFHDSGHRPVVRAFIEMKKSQRGSILDDTWLIDQMQERIKTMCWNNLYPSGGVERNPNAALQKGGNWGAPTTRELRGGGYVFQGFVTCIRYCLDGDWVNIKTLSWML